jgi:hypothetical protein
MGKDRDMELTDIQTEMSLKDNGKMMRSSLDNIDLMMEGPLTADLRKTK